MCDIGNAVYSGSRCESDPATDTSEWCTILGPPTVHCYIPVCDSSNKISYTCQSHIVASIGVSSRSCKLNNHRRGGYCITSTASSIYMSDKSSFYYIKLHMHLLTSYFSYLFMLLLQCMQVSNA